MKLSPKTIELIKNSLTTVVGISGLYSAYVTGKNENLFQDNNLKKIAEAEKKIQKLKQIIAKTENVSAAFKNKSVAWYGRLENLIEAKKKNDSELDKTQESLHNLSENLIGAAKNSETYSKILEEIKINKNKISYYNYERDKLNQNFYQETLTFQKEVKELTKIDLDNLDKSGNLDILNNSEINESFFGSEILEWIDTLNGMQKLGFSLVVCNYTILSCFLNVIAIFFGERIIKKYNLETKYPFLAKIFAWRKKFNFYYLIFNISIIFILSSAQLVFGISLITL